MPQYALGTVPFPVNNPALFKLTHYPLPPHALELLGGLFPRHRLFHGHELAGCPAALGKGGHPAEPVLQLRALPDRALAGIVAELRALHWGKPFSQQGYIAGHSGVPDRLVPLAQGLNLARVGARVRLSRHGLERRPRLNSQTEVIVGTSSRSSSFRVLIDGRKMPLTLHESYIERT
jgi:hypothetical protein